MLCCFVIRPLPSEMSVYFIHFYFHFQLSNRRRTKCCLNLKSCAQIKIAKVSWVTLSGIWGGGCSEGVIHVGKHNLHHPTMRPLFLVVLLSHTMCGSIRTNTHAHTHSETLCFWTFFIKYRQLLMETSSRDVSQLKFVIILWHFVFHMPNHAIEAVAESVVWQRHIDPHRTVHKQRIATSYNKILIVLLTLSIKTLSLLINLITWIVCVLWENLCGY